CNFYKKISPEETAEQQAILLTAQSHLVIHGQRGKADVDSVKIGDDIQHEQEWEQVASDCPGNGAMDIRGADHRTARICQRLDSAARPIDSHAGRPLRELVDSRGPSIGRGSRS